MINIDKYKNEFLLIIRALKIDRDMLLIVLVMLSLVGLLFFPRLIIDYGAKLRLEDITFIIIFFILLFRVLRRRFIVHRDFVLPMIYFAYPFMISLARAIGGLDWGFYFIIFWAKEFQYFIFFVVCFYLALNNKLKYIIGILIILIVLNDIVGSYKIINKVKDYYGIGAAFLEKDAPSLAGQVYFGCALFSALIWYENVIKRNYRKLVFMLIAVSFICCLATGSKSYSFGIMIFAVSFTVFHDMFMSSNRKEFIKKLIIKWGLIIGIIGLSTYYVVYKWNFMIFNQINIGRLQNPIESTSARYKYDLMPKLRRVDGNFDYITGVGYMAGQSNTHQVNFTSAYDNQFVRNILVIGIIGSIIWLIMLIKFGWGLRRSPRLLVFYCAMLVSYLAMGNGAESFGASKSGPVFWIITGILLGMNKREKSIVEHNE